MAGPEAALSRLSRDDAVATLFRVHHRRLVGLARLLVTDHATAEDVVQDAFTALYRRWLWVRDKDAAPAYLDRAVLNAARSQLRRRRVRSGVRRDAPTTLDSAETEAVRGDEHRRLRAGLAALPTRQREVLVLRYFLDRSEAEIAECLGISRGSVKQHASRGLAAMAQKVEAGS